MKGSKKIGASIAAAALLTMGAPAHAQEQPAAASRVQADAASVPASAASQKAADRQLRKRVARALGRAKELDASRMMVFARNGIVTLSGDMTDANQISMAVAVAQSVSGVTAVRNQLRIGMRER
jgi:osmotically-inducible protein OsmY